MWNIALRRRIKLLQGKKQKNSAFQLFVFALFFSLKFVFYSSTRGFYCSCLSDDKNDDSAYYCLTKSQALNKGLSKHFPNTS